MHIISIIAYSSILLTIDNINIDKFRNLKDFIINLEDDSVCFEEAKLLLNDPTLSSDLLVITTNIKRI